MKEIATFAAGCFWGVEETFLNTLGVLATQVGYCGGTVESPTYEMVCTGTTGHAEAVQVTFDPAVISYRGLLKVFFENHDPTTRNAQGPDIGDQYRSVIFFHSPEQEKDAKNFVDELTRCRTFTKPIVTQIVPAAPLHRAEEYHQQYVRKRGLGACHR